MRIERTGLFILAVLIMGSLACSEHNDSCPFGDQQVWGEINRDLNVSRNFVSRCEAPIGNFLADALLNYPYQLRDTDTGADISVRVALVNSGSIKDEIECGDITQLRDTLPRGAVTDQDIYQLLPNQDRIVIVKIKGGLLKSVMERAVSRIESTTAFFLQASAELGTELGIRVEVDCNGVAQELSLDGLQIATPGTRISRIHVGNSVINPADADSLEGIFYVAAVKSITETDPQGVPELGFVAFLDESVIVFETHLLLTDVVHRWLERYPRDVDYPVVEGRLELTGCPGDSGCQAP